MRFKRFCSLGVAAAIGMSSDIKITETAKKDDKHFCIVLIFVSLSLL